MTTSYPSGALRPPCHPCVDARAWPGLSPRNLTYSSRSNPHFEDEEIEAPSPLSRIMLSTAAPQLALLGGRPTGRGGRGDASTGPRGPALPPAGQTPAEPLRAAATGIFNNGSDFCMMNEALPLCT